MMRTLLEPVTFFLPPVWRFLRGVSPDEPTHSFSVTPSLKWFAFSHWKLRGNEDFLYFLGKAHSPNPALKSKITPTGSPPHFKKKKGSENITPAAIRKEVSTSCLPIYVCQLLFRVHELQTVIFQSPVHALVRRERTTFPEVPVPSSPPDPRCFAHLLPGKGRWCKPGHGLRSWRGRARVRKNRPLINCMAITLYAYLF